MNSIATKRFFQQVLFSRSGATGSPKVMGTTQRKVTG